MTDLLYIYIFVLAAFVGYEVISRVPVILHTPLMSGSNFVHGVVLVGAANAAGGYVVTERMLGMFAAKKDANTTALPSKEA